MNLIDYIALDKQLRKDAMDMKVMRWMCIGSNNYAVLAKIKLTSCQEEGRKKRERG